MGEKLHHVIDSSLNDTPDSPSYSTDRPVPQLLEKVVMRCLQKDPGDRYKTMEEMVRLLQQDWRQERFKDRY